MTKIIAIGSDHAGFGLKEELITYMSEAKWTVINKGCFSADRADYPDFAHEVARAILSGSASLGILLCGSGNGIAMSANKHKGIRAALCWNTEIALLARQHNDANILVLPARYMSKEEAINCVEVFMSAQFEGGRHLDRIRKIELY